MSSLGFLSEARLLWLTKLNPFTYFLWSFSFWNIIVFGSEIELLCAFVNIIYLHAQMHLREHLTRCSSSRQRVGVNLGVLISWHGVHVPYILSVMPSLSVLSFFIFPASAEILNGGVLVDQNKFLCHADTIHWQDIIKNPLAELLVVSSNSSNPGCEYNHMTPTPTCQRMPRVSHELFLPLRLLTRRFIILQMTSYCIHVFYNSIST